ncbi:unnamed protein product [Cochlearia groenlandica]
MVRKQRVSKVHEDRYPSCNPHGNMGNQEKDELVKLDMLDPPKYLRRADQDLRGKALSFGVLDWKLLESRKDTTNEEEEGSKGACCSYASSYDGSVETAASSLELDLATGVVKRLSKNLVERELSNASALSSCVSPPCPLIFSRRTNPRSETSSKLLSEGFRRHDVQGECSRPLNVGESNHIEKPRLLDQNIPSVTSEKRRHTSPNRRFSFSFSQMGRSLSSKESSSSVPASSLSHASAKSGPLTFNNSVYGNHHSTRTKPNTHNRTRSGPVLIPKSEKNVPLQTSSKLPIQRQPTTTTEKNQRGSRSRALLQFTLRKGVNLYQFVVDNNSNSVLAATMKRSDFSTRTYTLYSVEEVKNKTGKWLRRHVNEEKNHPFAHTITGKMKTVTSFTSDLSTHRSESVLFGVETNEELAAIVQTRNKNQRHNTTTNTTIILPSGFHTVPTDCNDPLPLIQRWRSGGACDCGGWDIGCKLRLLTNGHTTKSQTFSSFELFDQGRDEPVFKMVTHEDDLHSVEFGSSVTYLEAFFISLAVSSYENWCKEEEEEGMLKRETSSRYTPNPPVSPIGRV